MLSPPRLKAGDEIRVLAISRSLGAVIQPGGFAESDVAFATKRLESMGLTVSFGRHVRECNEHLTTSPRHRLEDLNEAMISPSVKAILAVTGGMGALQIVDGIDYQEISAHPKIFCGYSDVGHVLNAILARSGVTTYYGPNFTTFMMRNGADYVLDHFKRCLFTDAPIEIEPADRWSEDAWHKDQENRNYHDADGYWAIHEGEAEGRIVGGNYWCLNMLQGSSCFPSLRETILFLESPADGKATLMELDNSLRALSLQPEFSAVRALVLGRFGSRGGVTFQNLSALIDQIPALHQVPVIANCDFGHTTPMFTLPIGGRCKVNASHHKASVMFTSH